MQIVWHEAASHIPGRSQYYDDERGPEEGRFNIVPVKTKTGRFTGYLVTDEGSRIGEAKTADEAKALAQKYADNNPPYTDG